MPPHLEFQNWGQEIRALNRELSPTTRNRRVNQPQRTGQTRVWFIRATGSFNPHCLTQSTAKRALASAGLIAALCREKPTLERVGLTDQSCPAQGLWSQPGYRICS